MRAHRLFIEQIGDTLRTKHGGVLLAESLPVRLYAKICLRGREASAHVCTHFLLAAHNSTAAAAGGGCAFVFFHIIFLFNCCWSSLSSLHTLKKTDTAVLVVQSSCRESYLLCKTTGFASVDARSHPHLLPAPPTEATEMKFYSRRSGGDRGVSAPGRAGRPCWAPCRMGSRRSPVRARCLKRHVGSRLK